MIGDVEGAMKEYEQMKATIARLTQEVERLKDAARGRGMVSEMADMTEAAVLVCGLYDRAEQAEAEVERLKEFMGKSGLSMLSEYMDMRARAEQAEKERDDALATQIPPDSGALKKLGAHLADILDEDEWNLAEHYLLAAKGAQEQAEKDVTEARGMCDLYVDEFHRIAAATDNSEIKGLCERAVFGIKQRVPIIEQRDRLQRELAAERGKVEKQYELIDFYDAKVAAVMKWRESAYIPNDSDENELKRILLGE